MSQTRYYMTKLIRDGDVDICKTPEFIKYSLDPVMGSLMSGQRHPKLWAKALKAGAERRIKWQDESSSK